MIYLLAIAYFSGLSMAYFFFAPDAADSSLEGAYLLAAAVLWPVAAPAVGMYFLITLSIAHWRDFPRE